jgi:hypothetical protein
MDDQELQRRLSELSESWRIPRDPPLAEMWREVEARAFPAARARERGRWSRWLALAAMLLVGFGLGRLLPGLGKSASSAIPPAKSVALAEPAEARAPFVGIATDYLERVTVLLVTLTDAARRGQPLANSAGQARDLLATTRMLMDSPEARSGDPHLKELLDDLELVLAQIVRLPHRAAAPDVYLIDQTLDQREVLPRLRGLLAENPTSQP